MSETQEIEAPKLAEYVHFTVYDRVGNYSHGGLCEKALVQDQADADKGQTAKEGKFEFKRSELRPTYRMERRKRYPSINDQLGAACDLAKAIRDSELLELPPSVLRWIEKVEAVKREYPKDQA